MYENLPVVSVTEYHHYLNQVLGEMRFAVRGEISGYKVSQSKWVTFDLKDADSRVSCFTTVYKQGVKLEDGLEVICYGGPRVYVPYGKYSFNVDAISLVGEGSLKKAFELTKKQLEQEGLFDAQYKKKLPRFPKKIGLITSPQAAAYTDVLKILGNRWGGLDIFLKPVLVQGVEAPGQIAEAVEYYNRHFPVDVIILTRGGGSLEELQAFNTEIVCRAVFASKIPIISGVGHERDITLVDYVADIRAATPSNAAELAVPDRREFLQELNYISSVFHRSVERKIAECRHQLSSWGQKIKARFDDRGRQFGLLEFRLRHNFSDFVSRVNDRRGQIMAMEHKLPVFVDNLLAAKQRLIKSAESLLHNISPQTILAKGFTLTYTRKNRHLVSRASEISWGDKLVTVFSDGEIFSIADDIQLTKKL